MDLQRQVFFWIGALAVFILLVWALSGVLLPFVAGMALAYFLNPLADRLERQGLNRLTATLTVTGLFILLFVLIAIIVIPVLGSQLVSFIERFPEYFTRLQNLILNEANSEWLRGLLGGETIDLRKSMGGLVGEGANWAGALLTGLWSGGQARSSPYL
jgi:predicted PurR-regulated permease PerM